MKSTSGAHYIALDHVRAIAVLLVFSWHFIHGRYGYPSPFEGVPAWGPLVLFDEGHVGVAVFMTLSGYLFAKLLDGKKVVFRLFFWNRALRLFPVLILVMAVTALIRTFENEDLRAAYWYLMTLPGGFIFPTWPNGGWSIAVELHFYLLLPLLLFLHRRSSSWLVLFLVLAMSVRTIVFMKTGEVQALAYWTIFGRIDQFLLGILAFTHRKFFIGNHLVAALMVLSIITIYYWFDLAGGFYLLDGYPSRSAIWIVLAFFEGLAFASVIAWYDGSFTHSHAPLSIALSRIGEYSYSIYLIHVFFVFRAAEWIHGHVLDLSSFYVALPVALVAFLFMIPVGYLSMRYVEAPFLRLRKPYYASVAEDPLRAQAAAKSSG